jgi:hypothetical protein
MSGFRIPKTRWPPPFENWTQIVSEKLPFKIWTMGYSNGHCIMHLPYWEPFACGGTESHGQSACLLYDGLRLGKLQRGAGKQGMLRTWENINLGLVPHSQISLAFLTKFFEIFTYETHTILCWNLIVFTF